MSDRVVSTDRLEVVDLWADEYRSEQFLSDAIAELRSEYGDPEQPMGMYCIPGTDPRSSLGRAVELERFGESFDNDVPLMRELYGTFEDEGLTELLCVVDHERGRPAGVIRTVRNTAEHGCRILNDLQDDGENGWGLTWAEILERSDFAARRPEDIIDIPTIAVGREYSGARRADSVSKALCAAVFQHALRSDANTWVCSLDRIPYMLIQAYTANVMQEFAGVEGHAYHGAADTVPLWTNFREYEERLRRDHPDLHQLFVHNLGLEDYFFGWPDERVIDLRDSARRPGQTVADVPADQDEATARR
jgi:hypothetical protein